MPVPINRKVDRCQNKIELPSPGPWKYINNYCKDHGEQIIFYNDNFSQEDCDKDGCIHGTLNQFKVYNGGNFWLPHVSINRKYKDKNHPENCHYGLKRKIMKIKRRNKRKTICKVIETTWNCTGQKFCKHDEERIKKAYPNFIEFLEKTYSYNIKEYTLKSPPNFKEYFNKKSPEQQPEQQPVPAQQPEQQPEQQQQEQQQPEQEQPEQQPEQQPVPAQQPEQEQPEQEQQPEQQPERLKPKYVEDNKTSKFIMDKLKVAVAKYKKPLSIKVFRTFLPGKEIIEIDDKFRRDRKNKIIIGKDNIFQGDNFNSNFGRTLQLYAPGRYQIVKKQDNHIIKPLPQKQKYYLKYLKYKNKYLQLRKMKFL